MTASMQKGNPEKDHTKLYWVLGIIVAVLVAALILWNHGVFEKNDTAVAATIGDQSFDTTEVNYYYYQVYNNNYSMAKMYEQYGMQSGYDTSKSPEEQMYNADSGMTYADYFRETALTQLQQVTILTEQAKAAGHTLSEEGKASVNSQMNQIDASLLQYSVTYGGSEAYYLKMMYGENMTKSLLKKLVTKATLANEYAIAYKDQFTYDKAALETYYNEHKDDLDSYDFRFSYIAAKPQTDVDAEGNPAEPTEEQTAAAMETALQSAEAMAKQVKAGKSFNTAALDYADEATKEKFSDPEYNHMSDSLGSSLTGVYGTWLKDAKRKAGEVGVVKEEGSGYYVVQFLGRERLENSYETVDVNSILIQAETTQTTDEQGNTAEAPTEEQLAAARAKAEDILTQWDAVGEKSADAFLALVSKAPKSGEPKGETLTQVSRNTYGSDFDKWAFAPGKASPGGTVIVDATDNSGAVVGCRIMYLNAFGQVRWEYAAENALSSVDYQKWYDDLAAQNPITQEEGLNQVGVQLQ